MTGAKQRIGFIGVGAMGAPMAKNLHRAGLLASVWNRSGHKAAALAAELGWSFRDADDFHPPENVAKMSAGIPLNDSDRAPWLAAITASTTTPTPNSVAP